MYIFPVRYIKVTQGYHQNNSIDLGSSTKYYGHNQDILASNDGVILKIEKQTKGGNVVYIKHEDGWISEYAHLANDSILFKENDYVKRGDVIAKMGKSGNATGYHLHFAIYKEETRSNKKVKIFDNVVALNDAIIDLDTFNKYHIIKNDDNLYVFNVDEEGLIVRDEILNKTKELLKPGTNIKVLGLKDNYIKIGNNKYVYREYLSYSKPDIYQVINAPTGLNVRNKPNLNSKIVGIIYNNDPVIIYGKKNNFYKISPTTNRYIYYKYVKKVL